MYRNAPARSQNVKCRFIVTFVCTEEFLLGFFLSSRIITLSKILPLGPNFNLTCILYYILWRIHISDLSLNVCNCCRVKERKVNDDKRLEGQNGVTLYALGHFMARHKKYEWSVRIIIYSTKHSHFNDLEWKQGNLQ